MSTELRLQDYPLASTNAPRSAHAAWRIPTRLRDVLSRDDFEAAARRHLPGPLFAYVSGGCETDRALRGNLAAFEDFDWVTRVLQNTSARTLTTELFGRTWAAPVGIAPMGISALTAYRGDLVQTLGAAAANIPHLMSGSSLIRMEDVAAANPQAWFQVYVRITPGSASCSSRAARWVFSPFAV